MSETHWHALLQGLQEAVWIIGEESNHPIMYANHAAESLTGLGCEAMLGASVLSLAATPLDHAFWSQPSELLADGIDSHTSVLRGDGTLAPVNRQVRRVDWGDPPRSMLMLTMADRTEHVSTQRELEILLSELRATLDSAADGMLVCDLQGHVRAFNQQLAKLWNMPRELLTARDDAAVFAHLASQVLDTQQYAECMATIAGDPLRESTDILLLRSSAVLEMRSVPKLSHGHPVGRVYSYRDVTQQTEVQSRLRLAARVFESSLDAIFIADSRHCVLRLNPGCERLLGHSASSLEGRSAASLFGATSDFFLMEEVLSGWEAAGFWEGELLLQRAPGSHCAIQLSWVALRDDEGRVVQSIGFMRDLTGQHAAQKRIEQLAYSDALTGLPNRALLSQRVAAAIEAGRGTQAGFAIVFLDLDRFKIVNDSLGHPFGDRVLQLVAERLQTCLRQTDMLCRLGGDEFVIYLHGGDAAVAEGVARRILDDMLKPFTLDQLGFSIQCSMGIALYPRDGHTLDDLIKQADTAMYRVKERGRGSYGFYQPQMNANLLTRMQMEHAMRQAIGNNHMTVHYQPQVNMLTGTITAAEALARWTDPHFGVVSPGQFIALAEESGHIVVLGAWVMQQAIREAAVWMHSGMPITISVNVSALEFLQPDFVERVTRLLAIHQLPPTLLELELTETILLQDAQEMEQRLRVLADLGISLAIDDFGTGYSSLAYLKKLPIHKLKIDQSFVRGLPDDDSDRAIVTAIINMGIAMHMEVVAEGVETETQQAVLQQMRCDHYQGYLCAPGLPASDFLERLRKPLPLKAQGRRSLTGY